jgi:hypothetical protein
VKDFDRMVNFMRLIKKDNIPRGTVETMFDKELRHIRDHGSVAIQPVLQAEANPQNSGNLQPSTWLPWSTDGTCTLPIIIGGVSGTKHAVSNFLIAFFAALGGAKIGVTPQEESPIFTRLIESQRYMSERAFASMWNLWEQSENGDLTVTTDMFKTIARSLCQYDTALSTFLCSGFVFSCSCSQASAKCPLPPGGVGVWRQAETFPRVIILPALQNDIGTLLIGSSTAQAGSTVCHAKLSMENFALLSTHERRYFQADPDSEQFMLCKGILKFALPLGNQRLGPIALVACKEYFSQLPRRPAMNLEFTAQGNIFSLISAITLKTLPSGVVAQPSTWFRRSTQQGSPWYHFSNSSNPDQVATFNTEHLVALGYIIEFLLFVQVRPDST